MNLGLSGGSGGGEDLGVGGLKFKTEGTRNRVPVRSS